MKLPDNAGNGWTIFNGTNQPSAGICEIITLNECWKNYWESSPRPVVDWDWSIERVPGDIIAFRMEPST